MRVRLHPQNPEQCRYSAFLQRHLPPESPDTMSDFDSARQLIRQFKGDRYAFGADALQESGAMAAQLGQRAAVVCGTSDASRQTSQTIKASLASAAVRVAGEVEGARPNAPREDVFRIARGLRRIGPDVVVVVGGGSTIDAAKAADGLYDLGGPLDRYFGTGWVTQALVPEGQALTPLIAVQMASSSGAHLTKYSNVTDIGKGQKKLIVDEAIVPRCAVFQYDVTMSMPTHLTADGGLDGLSHLIEVLYGLVGREGYSLAEKVATVGTRLIVPFLERAIREPTDLVAREALGLGTDLGAYAIMIGGTNGGHLTSFSLVDVLSHGRACAIMNPYYTVFFAPAIERPLRVLGKIYRDSGLTTANIEALSGRDLGLAVAEAMLELSRRIGFPTTLREIEGFTNAHIERALTAAKDPQLRMKLENMPVPLTAEVVDEYMGPILEAARDGELSRIKNVG
jgi:alcohol dehydrogenase